MGLGPQHQEGETIAGYYAREFRMTLSFAFSKEGQTDTLCLSDSSTQRALGHGVMGPSENLAGSVAEPRLQIGCIYAELSETQDTSTSSCFRHMDKVKPLRWCLN